MSSPHHLDAYDAVPPLHVWDVWGLCSFPTHVPGSGIGPDPDWDTVRGRNDENALKAAETCQIPPFDLNIPWDDLGDFESGPVLVGKTVNTVTEAGFSNITGPAATEKNASTKSVDIRQQPDADLEGSSGNHGVVNDTTRPTCRCGKTFSRRDSLKRHIQTVTGSIRVASIETVSCLFPLTVGSTNVVQQHDPYPCLLCNKHRGARSFLRRDHLRQHLRVYHKMNREAIDRYFKLHH
ncbi:hypothetical protein V8F20_004135 [Naviculisporaceae sp. PSN 640]